MSLHSYIKPILNKPDSLLDNQPIFINHISQKIFANKIQYTEQYQNTNIKEGIYRNNEQYSKLMLGTDFIFIYSIALLAFLTYIKLKFTNVFRMLLISLTKVQVARLFINEKSGLVKKSTILMHILFILNMSLFLFSVSKFYSINFYSSHLLSLLLITGFTVLFYFIKYLLYKIFAYLTETQDSTDLILNHFTIFYRNLAIFLTPLSITSFFIHYSLLLYWLIFVILFIIIFSIIRIYRALILSLQMNFSFYYIFLYLCTIEILPIIYSIKLLKMWVI